jgi:hypothetical protein
MVELDISIIFAGLSIAASIAYYASVLRNQNKTRQTQLFMNIYNTFASKQYQKDRERMLRIWEFQGFDDFFMKYGPEVNPDDHAIFDMFLIYFEGIAVLVKRGLIDPNLVYDLIYGSIIGFWEKFEPVLLGLREMSESPKTLQDLEFLYLEMKRLAAEDGAMRPGIYSTPFIDKAEQ